MVHQPSRLDQILAPLMHLQVLANLRSGKRINPAVHAAMANKKNVRASGTGWISDGAAIVPNSTAVEDSIPFCTSALLRFG